MHIFHLLWVNIIIFDKNIIKKIYIFSFILSTAGNVMNVAHTSDQSIQNTIAADTSGEY